MFWGLYKFEKVTCYMQKEHWICGQGTWIPILDHWFQCRPGKLTQFWKPWFITSFKYM